MPGFSVLHYLLEFAQTHVQIQICEGDFSEGMVSIAVGANTSLDALVPCIGLAKKFVWIFC